MTVAEKMDPRPTSGDVADVLAELRALNQKMDRVEQVIASVTHRVESLEEIREDLWPMAQGASHAISRKLHELDRNGALGFAKEAARVGERIATSFSEEDVRLLGENVVSILQTVRNLTQPEVMHVADRAAVALRDSESHPERKLSLWKALKDPDTRRGMSMMLTVLREMGHEGNSNSGAAVAATAAKQGDTK